MACSFRHIRDSHGQVTLEAFQEATQQVPHGFRRHFEEDPNAAGRPAMARMAFWSTNSEDDDPEAQRRAEKQREEEEMLQQVLHELDTEASFRDSMAAVKHKVNVMEEEMQYLRDDLGAVTQNFELIVKHLQTAGIEGAQDFEMVAPEAPTAWYQRRQDMRKQKEAAERVAAATRRLLKKKSGHNRHDAGGSANGIDGDV